MDRIEYLYEFISSYIEEQDLPCSRIAIRAAREELEGIIRKSRIFDRQGLAGIKNLVGSVPRHDRACKIPEKGTGIDRGLSSGSPDL